MEIEKPKNNFAMLYREWEETWTNLSFQQTKNEANEAPWTILSPVNLEGTVRDIKTNVGLASLQWD